MQGKWSRSYSSVRWPGTFRAATIAPQAKNVRVAFSDLAATVSSSEITATVPEAVGAVNASGYVTVSTPSGTLTSNVPFLLGKTLTTTTATTTSSPNPSTSGQPVTFTATVTANVGTPPNGETVSFVKGTTGTRDVELGAPLLLRL